VQNTDDRDAALIPFKRAIEDQVIRKTADRQVAKPRKFGAVGFPGTSQARHCCQITERILRRIEKAICQGCTVTPEVRRDLVEVV
jgi:hypothetical protein